MKRILFLAAILVGVWAGWAIWHNGGELRDAALRYVDNGELITLAARYSPEVLMERHRNELLTSGQHSFGEPFLKYYPHLLIEAKYQNDKKTREGLLLWGLCDGEMVIDTESWEKTHGFADAIVADATRSDFKVMFALAKNKGVSSFEQLQRELHVEGEILKPWVESVVQKHLVVQVGNELQLHFQDPVLNVTPQTRIKQSFVSKGYQHSQCQSRKYSRSQIEKAVQAAFGPAFTIRNVTEVYLPVYGIPVINPDGSILSTFWNAINGKREG